MDLSPATLGLLSTGAAAIGAYVLARLKKLETERDESEQRCHTQVDLLVKRLETIENREHEEARAERVMSLTTIQSCMEAMRRLTERYPDVFTPTRGNRMVESIDPRK